MWNSRREKIYSCYAEEHPTASSPFYALVEGERFYNEKDYGRALALFDSIIDKHSAGAKVMQASLVERPWESKEKIFRYGELNAVGTALLLKGLIYYKQKEFSFAKTYLNEQMNDYAYAFCWNPDGWFVPLDQKSGELLAEIQKLEEKRMKK